MAFGVKEGTIYDVTDTSHINFIADNAEQFGLDKREAGDVYQRHNERVTTEGSAREEIVRLAASRGWIQVRHHSIPKDYCDASAKRRKVIMAFICWPLATEIMGILGYDDPRDIHAFAREEGGIKKYLSRTH